MSRNRKNGVIILISFLMVLVLIGVVLLIVVAGRHGEDAEDTESRETVQEETEGDRDSAERDHPPIGQALVENLGREDNSKEAEEPAAAPVSSEPAAVAAEEPKQPAAGTGNYGVVDFSEDFVTAGTEGGGVMSITENSDGSVNMELLRVQWEVGEVRVWKNSDGTYDIQGISGGSNVIGNALGSVGVEFDWNPINAGERFTLTEKMAAALEDTYGFRFH